MNALLLGYHGHQILNADESPLYPFQNKGKILIDRRMLNIATWKEEDCKKEWHSSPVELTREEQILNLCERFDKFACSDSDGDEWFLISWTQYSSFVLPK